MDTIESKAMMDWLNEFSRTERVCANEVNVSFEDSDMRIEEHYCPRADVRKMFRIVLKTHFFAEGLYKIMYNERAQFTEFKISPRILFVRNKDMVYWVCLEDGIMYQFGKNGIMEEL